MVALPSNFLFYSFKTLNIKPFCPSDLALIFKSAAEEDFSIIVEAIGRTLDQDILKFTIPDFYYLMYWHRLNSYLDSPFEIEWDSQYGTKEKTVITEDLIKFEPLAFTELDVAEWQTKGYIQPTVEDLLTIQQIKLTADRQWLMERAQFLTGKTMEEKITKIESATDLSVLEIIRKFREVMKHGVVETLKLTNSRTKDELVSVNKTLAAQGRPHALDLVTVPKFVAEVEDVTLRINALSFFPQNI